MDFRALTMEDICAMNQSTGRGREHHDGRSDHRAHSGEVQEGRFVRAGRAGGHERQGGFPAVRRQLQALAERLKLEVPVLVKARVRVEEGSNPKLMVSDITPLEEAKPKLPKSIRLKMAVESDERGYGRAIRDFDGAQR